MGIFGNRFKIDTHNERGAAASSAILACRGGINSTKTQDSERMRCGSQWRLMMVLLSNSRKTEHTTYQYVYIFYDKVNSSLSMHTTPYPPPFGSTAFILRGVPKLAVVLPLFDLWDGRNISCRTLRRQYDFLGVVPNDTNLKYFCSQKRSDVQRSLFFA